MEIRLGNIKWRRIRDVTQFEGIALRPGTYTGLDGHTITYTKEAIRNVKFEDVVVKETHDPNADIVGFVTRYYIDRNGALHILGYLFKDVPYEDLSIEANVITEEQDGKLVAKEIDIVGVALVPQGAVRGAEIVKAKKVALGGDKMSEEVKKVESEKESEKAGEVKEQDRPTPEEFWQFVAQQLKAIPGIGEEKLNEILKVLKTIIKTPYPYPYPAPKYPAPEQYPSPAKMEELESVINELRNKVAELEDQLRIEREAAQLNSLVTEVQNADPNANIDEILKDAKSFEEKKMRLEAYLSAVRKVRLSVSTPQKEEVDRIDRISMELFGKPLKEVLNE